MYCVAASAVWGHGVSWSPHLPSGTRDSQELTDGKCTFPCWRGRREKKSLEGEGRAGQRGSQGRVWGTDMADPSRQGGSERWWLSHRNLQINLRENQSIMQAKYSLFVKKTQKNQPNRKHGITQEVHRLWGPSLKKKKLKKIMMMVMINNNSNNSNGNNKNKNTNKNKKEIVMKNSCIQPPPSLQAAKKVWKDAEGRMGLELSGRPRRRTVGAHRYQSCTDIY